jgi:hypothetical protein
MERDEFINATGGPAFPSTIEENKPGFIYLGMTLRDYFAAKAMQGMLSQEWKPSDFTGANDAAADAYAIADTMLAARGAA